MPENRNMSYVADCFFFSDISTFDMRGSSKCLDVPFTSILEPHAAVGATPRADHMNQSQDRARLVMAK